MRAISSLIIIFFAGCSSAQFNSPAFDYGNESYIDYYFQVVGATVAARPECIGRSELSDKAKALLVGDVQKNIRDATWSDEVENIINAWDEGKCPI